MTTLLWSPQVLTPPSAAPICARLTLLGVPVEVSFRPVRDELTRRAEVGLGAVRSYADLTALSELPVDVPVPEHLLAPDVADRLRCVTPAAVEHNAGTVTRRAVAAVRVRSVVYEGARWAAALERASQFAPYAQRTVVLPRMPRNAARVRTEAAYYGVGVRVGSGEDAQWLAQPAPFRPRLYSAASWFFDETVLAAVTGAA
jgi:hypothetical protein